MALRDTLNRIENLVATASHLPLTGKAVIDEDDLIHLVEDLRRDLPQELERAEEIVRDRDKIIQTAQIEAERIVGQAKAQAERLIDENEVVLQATERSRMVIAQAQQQESEIMERTRQQATQLQTDADNYANQVFDQLIAHVTETFQGVRAAEAGLEQARQILQQAKIQMNQQSAQNVYAQTQSYEVQQPAPGYNQAQPTVFDRERST